MIMTEIDFVRVSCNDDCIKTVVSMESACFTDPWSENAFREVMENPSSVFYIAYADGRPAGFIGAYVLCGEAEILNVAVMPEFRRAGIGRGLMSELFRYCIEKKAETAFLEVRESNSPASALYESMGFKRAGIRRRYYDSPVEDAVIMIKNF